MLFDRVGSVIVYSGCAETSEDLYNGLVQIQFVCMKDVYARYSKALC